MFIPSAYFMLYKTGPMLTVSMYVGGQAILLSALFISVWNLGRCCPTQEVASRMLFSYKGFRDEKGVYGNFGDGNTHPHSVRKDLRRNF